MRISLVLATAICMLSGVAKAAPLLSSNVTYRDGNEQTSSIYNSAFDQIFTKTGYKAVKTPGMIKRGSMVEWLNRIYYRPQPATGRVFAKSGLRINGLVEFGKVYELEPNVFVGHLRGPVGEQADTVFYFDHMSEEAAGEIMKSVARINAQSKNYNADARARMFGETESSAFAIESATASPTSAAPAGGANFLCGTDPVPKYSDDAAGFVGGAVGCAGQFASGVWASTGGLVGNAIYGVGYTLIHPVDAFNNVVQGIGSVGAFLGNADLYLGQFSEDIKSLPLDTKVQILCELSGNVGASVVVAALLGGANSMQIVVKTKEAIAKVTEAAKEARNVVVAAKLAKISKAINEVPIVKAGVSDVKTVSSAVASTNVGKAAASAARAVDAATGVSAGAKWLAAAPAKVKRWYDEGKAAKAAGQTSEQMLAESKKLQQEADEASAQISKDLRRAGELAERDPERMIVNKTAYADFRADAKAFAAADEQMDGAKVQSFTNGARNAASELKKTYVLTADQEADLAKLDAALVEVSTKAKGLAAGSSELANVQESAKSLADRLNNLILFSKGKDSHVVPPPGGFIQPGEKAELAALDGKIKEDAKKVAEIQKAAFEKAGQGIVMQRIENGQKMDKIVQDAMIPCKFADMVEGNKTAPATGGAAQAPGKAGDPAKATK